MATVQPSLPPRDSSCPIKGMYQLFDLNTGQGSRDPADRIVIVQESLQAFVNALSPGAYSSITKINFKILDDLSLKPIGIYGSREEIVRFLREMGIVDVKMDSEANLRSGLYITCSFKSTTEVQTYVVYWPEDTTWNDTAASTVRCNRTTFMRYLTKLCDQLICLISTEHSELIAWGAEVDYAGRDSENDESDQLFDFTLTKTNKQEENVVARQGFTMTSPHLVAPPPQPNVQIDTSLLSPRLLCGEKTQGFMTTNSLSVKVSVEHFFRDHQSASQIRHLLEGDVVVSLSETLDDKAVKTLMSLGLSARFPREYEVWEKRRTEIQICFQKTLAKRQEETYATLEQDSGDIQTKVREDVIGEILKAFPMLRRDGFSSESSPADPIDSGEASGALQDLFSIYPKAESTFRGSIRAANLDKGIKGTDFQSKKERTLILYYLFDNYKGLSARQTRFLADAVLVRMDKQRTLGLLRSFSKEERSDWLRLQAILAPRTAVLSKEERMWRNAHDYASSVSDVRFLSYLQTIPATHFLHDAAVEWHQGKPPALARDSWKVAEIIEIM